MQRIFIAFLLFFITSYTNAQQDSLSIRTESTAWIIISDAALYYPASIVMIMNHELGHYVAASLFGAKDIHSGLRRNNAFGWTRWNGDLGRFGNSVSFLGGVLFSRALAEGSDCLIRHVNLPTIGQRLFSMTFMFSRFDFARYVLTDAINNMKGKRGSDIDLFVSQIAGHNNNSRFFTYTALFVIATIDLIYDWEQVTMHWNILKGKSYINTSVASQVQIRIHPCVAHGSFGISAGVVW